MNYLTTCVTPFRTYVPSPENSFRIPYGNVRLTFDGGQGSFNQTTGGLYPGYNPEWEFTFQFDLQGLPSNCDGCRIQVNSGTTCDLPEIRFWNREVEGAVNPWRPEWGAVYHSNKNGQARGYFSMFDGFPYDPHKSRTVVVFASDRSTRIACGVIRRSTYGECGNETNALPSTPPTPSPIDMTPPPAMIPSPIPSAIATSQPLQTPGPSAPFGPDPTKPTPEPLPTNLPAPLPTNLPTPVPTNLPTPVPTHPPTPVPTNLPTPFPVNLPTPCPTKTPDTSYPIQSPSNVPGGKGVTPPNDPGGKGAPPDEDPIGKGSGKGAGKGGRKTDKGRIAPLGSKDTKGGKKELRHRRDLVHSNKTKGRGIGTYGAMG